MWPEEFCRRMEALLGEETPAFFASMEQEPSRALRLNPSLFTAQELFDFQKEAALSPVPFGENAFYFTYDGIGHAPLHHSGALYVQEAAAMAPVASLGKTRVRRILDLCAAPGGKSLQAASLLAEDGILVCNEPVPVRRKALMQNLERMGEARCAVTAFDASDLPRELAGLFDLVICDVPCSGEGMMRKHEEARHLWSPRHIAELSRLQKSILESAARAVAPGGRILYSTCTWSREENEDNLLSFLSQHPDFAIEAPEEAVKRCGREGFLPGTLRFYPHLFQGEGQFLAVLRHNGREKEVASPKKEKMAKKDGREAIVHAFFQEALNEAPCGPLLFRGDDVFLSLPLPFSPDLTVSPGVYLGQIRGKLLFPHHRFFRAKAHCFRNRFVLPRGDVRCPAYLRGEEIPLEGRGYGVLFEENKPLGGVKVSGGRGKNLYPKGIREA